jgi:hypothetical protein
LLVQARQRHALDPLHGAPEDDGGDATFHFWRHIEDRQSAKQRQVEDIMEAYMQAWKLGLKAVAIYRDGCKQSQPLSAAGTSTANSEQGRRGELPLQ